MTATPIHPSESFDTDAIGGIWPPWLLSWDESWALDMKASDANLDRLIAAQPHGLYTLDTASEFYTHEFDDWLAIARRFVGRVEASGVKLPLGLGCTWTNMTGVVARIEAARDLGVQIIHLAPLYWLPLNEEGLLRFFDIVQAHVGHLRVLLYAPPHGKLSLTGALYRRLADRAPCLLGSKTRGQDPSLFELSPPGHRHFVGEERLVSGIRAGGVGTCTSLGGIGLGFVQQWWAMIQRGDWEQAQRRQEAVGRFYKQAVQPIRDRGICGGAIDKAMAQAGGAAGTRLQRPPYVSVPDDLYANLVAARTQLFDAEGWKE